MLKAIEEPMELIDRSRWKIDKDWGLNFIYDDKRIFCCSSPGQLKVQLIKLLKQATLYLQEINVEGVLQKKKALHTVFDNMQQTRTKYSEEELISIIKSVAEALEYLNN